MVLGYLLFRYFAISHRPIGLDLSTVDKFHLRGLPEDFIDERGIVLRVDLLLYHRVRPRFAGLIGCEVILYRLELALRDLENLPPDILTSDVVLRVQILVNQLDHLYRLLLIIIYDLTVQLYELPGPLCALDLKAGLQIV
jgi:hypothetical protein